AGRPDRARDLRCGRLAGDRLSLALRPLPRRQPVACTRLRERRGHGLTSAQPCRAAVPRIGNWRLIETLHNAVGDSHPGPWAVAETALNVVSFLSLGFFLGMRHATDADHVVAIATIVSRQRSVAGSALIGAAWGVGHTITVMAVGAAIIAVGGVIPPRLGLSMEFAVGIMLLGLGGFPLTGVGRSAGGVHRPSEVPGGPAPRPHD